MVGGGGILLQGLRGIDAPGNSAPTALGIRQEVERIRDSVFYLTFLTVFIFFSGTLLPRDAL